MRKYVIVVLLFILGLGSEASAYKKIKCFVIQPPEKLLPGIKRLAVFDFEGRGSHGRYLADVMIQQLLQEHRGISAISGGLFSSGREGRTFLSGATTRIFDLVERNAIEAVFNEQNLGMSGVINVTPNWVEQTIDFTALTDIIANNKLYFQFGSQTGEVWIDDVLLKEVQSSMDRPTESRLNSYRLYQNYPNPANPETTIKYSLATSQQVELSLFGITGHRVETLVDERQNPGEYAVVWNGRDALGRPLASGIYFYRLITADAAMTRKIILAK